MQASASDRDCLARAMYFESNRSSPDGMLAVGSVVMNRYESGRYGDSICSVVGAPHQFAPGVLTRAMSDRSAPVARGVADAVLSGERHSKVGDAKFFHMAGLRFPYSNMHYVTVAGGNAFYEKRDRNTYESAPVMMASAEPVRSAPVQSVAFKEPEEGRFGEVIRDLNAVPLPVARPVMIADAAPQAVPTIRSAPAIAMMPAAEEPGTAIEKPAVAALMAPAAAPLPPKRPKLLGAATTPEKRASIDTYVRVADNMAR